MLARRHLPGCDMASDGLIGAIFGQRRLDLVTHALNEQRAAWMERASRRQVEQAWDALALQAQALLATGQDRVSLGNGAKQRTRVRMAWIAHHLGRRPILDD